MECRESIGNDGVKRSVQWGRASTNKRGTAPKRNKVKTKTETESRRKGKEEELQCMRSLLGL